MSLGWEKVDYDQILSGINPKLSCAETKYADAMVKAEFTTEALGHDWNVVRFGYLVTTCDRVNN